MKNNSPNTSFIVKRNNYFSVFTFYQINLWLF